MRLCSLASIFFVDLIFPFEGLSTKRKKARKSRIKRFCRQMCSLLPPFKTIHLFECHFCRFEGLSTFARVCAADVLPICFLNFFVNFYFGCVFSFCLAKSQRGLVGWVALSGVILCLMLSIPYTSVIHIAYTYVTNTHVTWEGEGG